VLGRLQEGEVANVQVTGGGGAVPNRFLENAIFWFASLCGQSGAGNSVTLSGSYGDYSRLVHFTLASISRNLG
jgi:hypothetical protein